MLEYYHPNTHETLKRNYLADFIKEEANRLKRENYDKHHAQYKLTAISYFGDWLKKRGISLKKLQKSDVDRFLKEFRPRKQCNEFYDKSIHRGVVRYAALSVLSHSFEKYPEKLRKTAIQREVCDFAEHLDKNYGIAIPTIRRYKNYLEIFLSHHFAPGRRISMKKLTPRMVRNFILKLPPIKDERNRKDYCSMLNNYFHYLLINGRKIYNLPSGIPSFQSHHQASTTPLLKKEHLNTFLNSIDRSTPMGLRTYATVLCQADLGLRTCDVSRITLDDIDWRNGTIRVGNSKSLSEYWLPLPKRVGEALADYLKNARPTSTSRIVFLLFHRRQESISPYFCHLHRPIQRQWKIAGLDHLYSGTHVLRHYAATQLKQKGTSIKVLSDILGHSSLQITSIYAKVDVPALRECAQPWPVREGGAK